MCHHPFFFRKPKHFTNSSFLLLWFPRDFEPSAPALPSLVISFQDPPVLNCFFFLLSFFKLCAALRYFYFDPALLKKLLSETPKGLRTVCFSFVYSTPSSPPAQFTERQLAGQCVPLSVALCLKQRWLVFYLSDNICVCHSLLPSSHWAAKKRETSETHNPSRSDVFLLG